MYISIHILQKETASDLPFGKKMFIKNKKKLSFDSYEKETLQLLVEDTLR